MCSAAERVCAAVHGAAPALRLDCVRRPNRAPTTGATHRHTPMDASSPTLDAASADISAIAAAERFLRPRRRPEGPTGDAARASPPGEARTLNLPEGGLRWWLDAGDPAADAIGDAGAPTAEPVLLVHGWEGRPGDLEAIGRALRAAGHRLIWVELPAHGGSTIPWSSVPHAAQAVAWLGSALGPLAGVVAHSVGGAAATLAMAQGLVARRVVLIGAPAEYRDYLRGFAAQAGLDTEGAARMAHWLRQHHGIDVARVSTPAAARGLSAPALLLHSRDDPVVPFRDAERIAAAWPAARLQPLDDLGHRRLLDDADVVAAVVGFLGAADARPG